MTVYRQLILLIILKLIILDHLIYSSIAIVRFKWLNQVSLDILTNVNEIVLGTLCCITLSH